MVAAKKKPTPRTSTTRQLEKKLNDGLTDVNSKLDRVVESMNSALEVQQHDFSAKVNQILEAVSSTRAADNPVNTPRKGFDAADQDMGPDESTEFAEAADGEIELLKPGQNDVESPIFKAKAEELKFMEDVLEVEIHESSDQNAEPRFAIYVGGDPFVFERGREFPVKRKFVEGLARAKPVHFRCEEYVKQAGGVAEKAYRYPAHKSVRYPFQVLSDPSPRGREWLQSVLRQP